MLRTMVFIDSQNFEGAYKIHTQTIGLKDKVSIDYLKLSIELDKRVVFQSQVIKTYLFVAKPDDKLLSVEHYKRKYDWICGLKNKEYVEIIEGRQVLRNIKGASCDLSNPETYTTEEKGTDVNIAVQMLSKGYQNSYDIAILVSGDTDYIPVVECLHNIGKTVVLATFPEQNIDNYKNLIDYSIKLDDNIINGSVYKPKFKTSKPKSIKLKCRK